MKIRDKIDEVEEDIESYSEELVAIGGENQEEFAETTAKERFDIVVSGKDTDALKEYADVKGYAFIMRELDKAKVELEKKQSGE